MQAYGSRVRYTELVVTFGFLALWGVTFPFAGVLAFGLCVLEVHVDQYKLSHMVRRPFPKHSTGIASARSAKRLSQVGKVMKSHHFCMKIYALPCIF